MDSEEEGETAAEASWRDGVSGRVLLVDARDPGRLGTAERALSAACASLREELRTGSQTLTSVALYNTRSGIAQIVSLAPPSLAAYRAVRVTLPSAHGEADSVELADALWHCSRVFASCSRKLAERTVVVAARLQEAPPQPARRPALKRVVDLANMGVTLRLVNVSAEPYAVDSFYRELLRAASGESAPPPPTWSLPDLEALLSCFSHRRASTARLRMHFGERLSIGVGIYKLCSPRPLPKKANLSKDKNEIVSSSIATVKTCALLARDAESAPREVPLLKSEILQYQVYGNERIEFTSDEINQLKNPFGPPTMKLLGFKPKHWLMKEKWYLKQCTFLFPDEASVKGSTRALAGLHRACHERGVAAFCSLMSRTNTRPRAVALIPCERPLGLTAELGFDVVPLPYLENMKEVPQPDEDEQLTTFNPVKLDFMKEILTNLSFLYTPHHFQNPKLQCLLRAIEALALDEESMERFVDTTKPVASAFEKVNGELFDDVFGRFAVSSKRAAVGGRGGVEPPSKRVQAECIDESLLQSRLQTRQLHMYNVNELKQVLRWKKPSNLPALTGLKKGDLVQLVYQHCH